MSESTERLATLPPAEAGSRLMSLKRRATSEPVGHFSDISRAAALAATHPETRALHTPNATR